MTSDQDTVIVLAYYGGDTTIETTRATIDVEKQVWERYKEICKSQGSNASTELRRHIIETVRTAEARSDSEQQTVKKET